MPRDAGDQGVVVAQRKIGTADGADKQHITDKGAPPQWLSTHPSGDTRIREMEAKLPKVMPLYERAKRG